MQLEIRIIEQVSIQFPGNTSIIKMMAHFQVSSEQCIVMELSNGLNLFQEQKKVNKMFRSSFTIKQIQSFTNDLVDALSILFELNIVHGDIKLENLLLVDKHHNHVKLIDFGISCVDVADSPRQETVQCLCNRAPEIILGCGYGKASDIWALGCVVAEMYIGKSLFDPPSGQESALLALHMLTLGSMPPSLLTNDQIMPKFFPGYEKLIDFSFCQNHQGPSTSTGVSAGIGIATELGAHVNPHLLDFIVNCLRLDPSERMTPFQALQHPFLIGMRDQQLSYRRQSLPDLNVTCDDEQTSASTISGKLTARTIGLRRRFNETVLRRAQSVPNTCGGSSQETKVFSEYLKSHIPGCSRHVVRTIRRTGYGDDEERCTPELTERPSSLSLPLMTPALPAVLNDQETTFADCTRTCKRVTYL
jgi:serine/threonine protein kinase